MKIREVHCDSEEMQCFSANQKFWGSGLALGNLNSSFLRIFFLFLLFSAVKSWYLGILKNIILLNAHLLERQGKREGDFFDSLVYSLRVQSRHNRLTESPTWVAQTWVLKPSFAAPSTSILNSWIAGGRVRTQTRHPDIGMQPGNFQLLLSI